MNKVIFKRILLLVILTTTLCFLGFAAWHYFHYDKALNSEDRKTEVIKNTDLLTLRKFPDNQLKNMGFNKTELLILKNRGLNNLMLNEILNTFSIVQDEYKNLSYSNMKHSTEGRLFTNFIIAPEETIFLPKEDETYLKLNYTTTIENPLFFQTKGNIIIENNWNYIFGIIKLDYYSPYGEKRTIYKANSYNNQPYTDLTKVIIDFNFKEEWKGTPFYLKDISGMMVIRKRGYSDFSSYIEINQKYLLTQKNLAKHWFDYFMQ